MLWRRHGRFGVRSGFGLLCRFGFIVTCLALPDGVLAEPGGRAGVDGSEREASDGQAQNAIRENDARLLRDLLSLVDARDAELRRIERTPMKQAKVMYDLAKEDAARAKEMYCEAGDAVIDVFDPKMNEADNIERMRSTLLSQLPLARELGCLNHIENDDVYSVDIALDAIEEGRRASFVEAANKAVREGKAERFLEPPRHPGAFHFEFRKK